MNKNFVKWLLKSNLFQEPILSIQRTAQNGFNKTDLAAIYVPLPPLPEQQRIVAKLDTLFAQLETIKTSMTNIPLLLKDFRQQVLTQAFTGKLTGCKVEIKRLGDLLIDVKYGTSMKSEYEIDGTPIFRIPNINDGEINDKDLKFSILDEKEYSQLKLNTGDILIIRSNGSVSLVGRSAIIREKHIGFAYAGYLIRLRCGEELNPDFLNYTLRSDFLRTQIVNTSHSSSGVNNINSQEIKDLKLYWTLPKEQQEIVTRVESLFAKADAIEQQYKSLKNKIDTLPQAMLHKAFKGELTEQLESDGDAMELLKQIQELKNSAVKPKKATAKKVKKYLENEAVLGMVAEE
jgi:type I restriction enzyme S subunit